jgi:hypothetical protein
MDEKLLQSLINSLESKKKEFEVAMGGLVEFLST